MDHYVRPGDLRPRDGLGRLEPRNPFLDPLALTRALPGLGGVFDREVPESHRTEAGVRCVCGTETGLPDAAVTACEGSCGRWFWKVGGTIRAAAT